MSRKLVTGEQPKPRKGADKGGRPPTLELTPEIVEKAEAALRIGSHILPAFAYQGIGSSTLRLWIMKGHEEPNSVYGALLLKIQKAMAEWETRTIAAWETAINGRPAEYEREVVKDKKGNVILDEKGKPMTQVARDADGNPILRRPAVKPDWKASMEMLARRQPKSWANKERVEVDAILTFDNKKPESKEALSFEQRIAQAIEKLEEDV